MVQPRFSLHLYRSHSAALFPLLLLLLLGAGCAAGPDQAGLDYPDAPRGEQVDDYHGTEVADPYRWLEELESEATAAWVEAENELARPLLESIPARAEIEARLTELWDHERYSVPAKEGGRYFFRKNDGLQNQSVLYTSESLDGEARVLLDPNTLSEDGTVSLSTVVPSPDGKHIAYSLSDGGSDWRTWRIRDVESGQDLPEVLGLIKFTLVSWAVDGKSFYYSRYPEKEGAKPYQGDGKKTVSIYRHLLGTEQQEDELVLDLEHETRNPYAQATEDGKYLVVTVQEGYLENAIHVKRLDRPGAEIEPLLDEWDALYVFLGNEGSTFYFQTNHTAPRNRVIAVDLDKPQPEAWREVIPQVEDTLEQTTFVGGSLVARYLNDAKSRVAVYSTDGSLRNEVSLPGIGSADGFGGRADDPETFYSFESFTVPESIYRYDVATGESSLVWQPELDVDRAAYETKQVFYASKDGTEVPMFITHRKGLELDGENPTLLFGYGGFNVSLTPAFSTARMVWLEMGGILAIPNLRGGGEYGREWHMAGARLNKQNVFDDFIAAAEYLIAESYTSTPKLAIQGGSNGGLLVGAALTQRPDLFGAALPAVGVLDMLRYHLPSANARNWQTDYGLSENEEDFEAQIAYSPLHNVEEGVCYPPTLITTADHDDRVVPWHSFKFGATLQHAQGCDNPILVRVETRAGHGAGTPTWMQIENLADQWAFLAEHLDMGVELEAGEVPSGAGG